ncbi:MAG: hypothetical protein R3335_13945, partial [Anaerolineales bacterium]|nr:hypothetical protein [Anaerolineales bacterium]
EASQPAAALEEEQPTAEADLSGATNGDEQAEEAVIDPDSGAGEEEADEKPKRGRKRTQKKIETE